MDIITLLGLAGLALVDSTSIGTLVLPIVLLLLPGFRAHRFVLYLATITLFYFGVGVLLLLGATQLVTSIGELLASRAAIWAQLVAGAGLFVASWFIDPGREARERKKAGLPPEPSRWERRLAGNAGAPAIMGVALLAGLAEVATMLPYLGAVGILATSSLPWLSQVGVLAGYVVVMSVPALIFLGVRLAMGERAHARLAGARDWVARQAAASLPWVIGIVGFLLARDAAYRLGLLTSFLGG